jgi:SpoVK/Ycf46/Vps4 family AAA+-type ATPase
MPKVKGEALFKHPIMFLQAETVMGNSDRYETDFLLVHPDDSYEKMAVVFDTFIEIEKEVNHSSRCINVYGSDDGIELSEASHSTWADVFLSESVEKAVKNDIEFFLENESVFREVGIPYKRGYLLCGPPGCGKTSIIRVLATSMPFASYMFDFSNPDFGNSDLTEAFKWATKNTPAIFILEDIDRIYNPDGPKQTSITLDHLLNCLDGIAVNDGLVVVATANNPKNLDPAILSRPGRFDKVVEIGLPDHTLRYRYLKHLFRTTKVTAEDITFMTDETESLSMAFLKEVFVVSASRAVMAKEILNRSHIEQALDEILKQYSISRGSGRKAGFGN